MKKFIVTLLLLVAGVTMRQIHAADVTVLTIGDCRIAQSSSSFVSDIRPSGLTSGTITYDNSARTLTLDNITFSTDKVAIDVINIPGLVIYVKGTCNIYSSSQSAAMYFGTNTNIVGLDYSAKLNVTAASGIGLSINGPEVQTYWVDLSVWAPETPVYSSGKKFYVNYSKLDAIVTGTASDACAITCYAGLGLVDVVCTNGQYFKGSYVVERNGNRAKEVHILPKLAIGGFIVPLSRTDMSSLPEDARAAAGITSGTVEWNSSTNELKFTDVKQNVTSTWCGITNMGVDNLKVTFSGSNSLTVPSNHVIYSEKNIKLEGSSTVADKAFLYPSENTDWCAVKSLKDLSVSNIYLSSKAYSKAIEGDATNSKLTINGATIFASTSTADGKAISGFADCSMSISEVSHPYGCDWNESLHGFGTGYALDKSVTILKPTKTYPVSIFGRALNDANIYNMKIFKGITSGDVSYNQSTNKLILNDAKLDSPTDNENIAAIKITDADIELRGTNNINSVGSCIVPSGKVNVTGSGSMEARSSAKSGVSSGSSKTKFSVDTDNYFGVYGKRYGFWSYSNKDTLALTKSVGASKAYVFQGNEGAVTSLGVLKLDNMDYGRELASDRSDYYFADGKVLQNGGTPVTNSRGAQFFAIKEKHDIYVANKQLCSTMDGRDIQVGSPYISTTSSSPAVTYNSSTNTLTLNNATIKYDGDDSNFQTFVNYGKVGDLDIELIGDNNIETTCFSALEISDYYYSPTTTIKGSGTLTAKSKNIAGYVCGKGKLTIDGAQVIFEGGTYGIGDNNNMNKQKILTVQNGGAVKATGKSGAVTRMSSIQLKDDIKVSRPEGAVIKQVSSSYGYGVYEGSTLAKSVVLSNGNSIFDFIPGDANGDGSVTMADANLVVNYFLAADKSKTYINLEAANVNGDDDITMADANMIVNMFLGGKE